MANGFSYGVFEGDCTYAETHDSGAASAIAAALNRVVDENAAKAAIAAPQLPEPEGVRGIKAVQADVEKLWDQDITHRRIVRASVVELRAVVDAFLDTRGHCRTEDMWAFVNALSKVSGTLLKCADNNKIIEQRLAELDIEIKPLLERDVWAARQWDKWMIRNNIGGRQ